MVGKPEAVERACGVRGYLVISKKRPQARTAIAFASKSNHYHGLTALPDVVSRMTPADERTLFAAISMD
jgi:hypothetical protein